MKKILLVLLLVSTNLMAKSEQHLTLYFIPSPMGLDWSSPADIALSALKNRLSFRSHFMGHVFVELECGNQKEQTGMVGKNFDYLTQLFVHKRGLGILYHSFDGHLEDKADVQEELNDFTAGGSRINFVQFNLNEGQCNRTMTYLKEYRKNNVGRYYGLANRPLYGEGSGCSAFGASFAEVAGVMDMDIKEAWTQTINIPHAFAGPPLQEKGVSIFTLISSGTSWAKENEPHQKLTFWSPDLMFDWVNQKVAKSAVEKFYKVKEIGYSKGIVIDRSFLPAPSGPIWQQHLDPNIKKTKEEGQDVGLAPQKL